MKLELGLKQIGAVFVFPHRFAMIDQKGREGTGAVRKSIILDRAVNDRQFYAFMTRDGHSDRSLISIQV